MLVQGGLAPMPTRLPNENENISLTASRTVNPHIDSIIRPRHSLLQSRNHLPLLAFVWALSVVCLGLSAHLINACKIFPVSQYHAVMIQTVFAWAWNVSPLG